MKDVKKSILFLCTGNSCRSQMAEGWGKALLGELVEVYSAGTSPQGVNPTAVRVMKEVGVDISSQRSKHVGEYQGHTFDLVVTVCDAAAKACPSFHGAREVLHHEFDDPPRLAAREASFEEGIRHFRRVRDEIKEFVESLRVRFL